MGAWIPFTLAAALVQTLRFMVQRHLKATRLSTGGATFARFVYSAPLIVVLLLTYAAIRDVSLPSPTPRFWVFAIAGGLGQILATMCVVALFSLRNFAVGITFKKTEVMQTALLGFVILGEGVSLGGLIAITIGLVGVLLLSNEGGFAWRLNRAAGLGILSGALFAVAAIGYRGATLEMLTDDLVLRSGTTLAIVTSLQALSMAAWLAFRERGQISATLGAWRIAGLAGVFSMIGSFCWFTAFSLQNAAYVKALGQTELMFSLLVSILVFRERVSQREVAGMGLITLSVIVLVLVI